MCECRRSRLSAVAIATIAKVAQTDPMIIKMEVQNMNQMKGDQKRIKVKNEKEGANNDHLELGKEKKKTSC